MNNEIKTVEIKGVSVRGYQGLAYVELDGTVRIWDEIANHYTTCHSLSATALRNLDRLAKRARKHNQHSVHWTAL